VQTFTKQERIARQKEIDALFSQGRTFTAYPLRVFYLETTPLSPPHIAAPVAILISVPKKRVKQAVKRNRIKRIIRETYRRNKKKLHETALAAQRQLRIAFLYIGTETNSGPTLAQAVKTAIETTLENRDASN
jgi:ribonuclease P protein component